VAIVTVNAVVAVMVVVAVVAKPPAMAPMRIFGVWTVSGAPVSVLHSRDISLDISNVKIYLDTICACAGGFIPYTRRRVRTPNPAVRRGFWLESDGRPGKGSGG
jgi:hypothetical protein